MCTTLADRPTYHFHARCWYSAADAATTTMNFSSIYSLSSLAVCVHAVLTSLPVYLSCRQHTQRDIVKAYATRRKKNIRWSNIKHYRALVSGIYNVTYRRHLAGPLNNKTSPARGGGGCDRGGGMNIVPPSIPASLVSPLDICLQCAQSIAS